jgi:hypothetical protein
MRKTERKRFPFYAVDPRHSASLRNRWFVFAQWSVVCSLQGWRARISDERDGRVNCVTLLRLGDADMFLAAMRSLSLVRPTLPPLLVVCDRDEDAAALKDKLDRHLEGVIVDGPQSVRRELLSHGEEVVAELTKKHVFWLKFAAVLLSSKVRETIYTDADVLFFRDPQELADDESGAACMIANDCFVAYSDWLIDLLRIRRGVDLLAHLPGNAGVGIYRQGFERVLDRDVLKWCLEQRPSGLFDEQTFTAYTALTRGKLLSKSDVYVDTAPLTSFRASWRGSSWVARHYIGPIREQFWIDAWRLLGRRACGQ